MVRYRVSVNRGSIIFRNVSRPGQRITIRRGDSLRGRRELLRHIVSRLSRNSNNTGGYITNNDYYNRAIELLGTNTHIININSRLLNHQRVSPENVTRNLENYTNNQRRSIQSIRNLPVGRRNNVFNEFFSPRDGENTTRYWNNNYRWRAETLRRIALNDMRRRENERKKRENQMKKSRNIRHLPGAPAA